MKLTPKTNILIVGLGVIGGSYAKALTKQGFSVSCFTRKQKDVDYALEKGIVARGSAEVRADFIAEADLIVLALYPHILIDWLRQNQHLIAPGTLLTDVTGVKGDLVEQVQAMLRPDLEFIAAHPMAGRESSGVEYSDDSVFRGANFIVTPTEKNTPEAIATAKELGSLLGFSRISELTPEKHDEMIAFVSQLTHCIAVALMNCDATPGMERYTGDSFRDLTRIAKINDEMWSELFLWNREALLRQMDAFLGTMNDFRSKLEQGDREGMREMMRISTARRGLFDKPTVGK